MRNKRKLILLRHAHAEQAMTGQPDLDRPLSSEGLKEAKKAAGWLKKQGLTPDLVLHSGARRTRETLDEVLTVIGSTVEQRQDERIYDATPGDLMKVLEDHSQIEQLMVVGHNPGLEQLVALLNTGLSSDHRGMPPASVAVLELLEDAPIEPEIAKLTHFWWP